MTIRNKNLRYIECDANKERSLREKLQEEQRAHLILNILDTMDFAGYSIYDLRRIARLIFRISENNCTNIQIKASKLKLRLIYSQLFK